MIVENDSTLKSEIPFSCQGMRMDKALAISFPEFSRSTLQKWLKQGLIVVDEEIPSQRDQVQGGEVVELMVPQAEPVAWQPQPISLNIVYADDYLVVVNKPAGLVVHPGAGNPDGTLVNGLLHYDASLAGLPRAGIVHRLDKNTTGLMVVARNESARLNLIKQLAGRSLKRTYYAVVQGVPVAGGVIDEPIGRDPNDRRRMMVSPTGKPAVTRYWVKQRFRSHVLLRCQLETGRTHQIRVHLRYIGYPIIGDSVYGGRRRLPPKVSDDLRNGLLGFSRQALHAKRLALSHPHTKEHLEWSAPVPADLDALITSLAEDARLGK